MNRNSAVGKERRTFNENEGQQGFGSVAERKKFLWEKEDILRVCNIVSQGPLGEMVLIGVAAEVLRGFRGTSPTLQFAHREQGFAGSFMAASMQNTVVQGSLKIINNCSLKYHLLGPESFFSTRQAFGNLDVAVYSMEHLEAIGLSELSIHRTADNIAVADMSWNADFMGIFGSPYMDKIAKIVSAADHAYNNNFIEQKDFMLFGDIITFNELPPEAQKPLIHNTLLSRIEASDSSVFLNALLVGKGPSS